jgi:mono/diheme cytochrome c family protein
MPQTHLSLLRTHVLLLVVACCAAQVAAADPPDFAREVAPILRDNCVGCHSADNRQGDLSLATADDLLQQQYVLPGEADDSHLLSVVQPDGDQARPQMPKKGRPLSREQVAVLRRWIAAGAGWPDDYVIEVDAEAGRQWWSLQPPVAQRPPSPDGLPPAWDRNPIDRFVFAALREDQLAPSPPADRRTWIRRVTLDLTGLPPSPQEVAAFVEDPGSADHACGRVAQRLLASPRYGERWAQHWLDVIRWAETVGFETNSERPRAWPYRDWVIDALNADKPYDQFVFEQIAGDTVGEDAALGFLVAGPANLPGQVGRDEPAMRQARQDELDEVIQTVSQCLFGLTIGCARCHDHKFDPILQRDYYAMQAIFAGLTYGERRLRGEQNDQWTAEVPAARERLEALRQQRSALQQERGLRDPLPDVGEERFEPVDADAVRMRIEATGSGGPASLYELEVYTAGSETETARNVAPASAGGRPSASGFALENQTRHFDNLVDGSVDKRQAFPWVNDQPGPAWVQVDFSQAHAIDRIVWHQGASTPADYRIEVRAAGTGEWIEVAHTRDRLPRVDDIRSVDRIELVGLSAGQVRGLVENAAAVRAAQAELSRLSAGPQVYAARFDEVPEQTWLLDRGDPMQRTQPVEPGVPAALQEAERSEAPDSSSPATERTRRVALALHLTQPEHPLTARVIVNRIWQHHFGTGLVATPSDFGRMGAEPSHPELLDWLAIDFVAHGWSMKHLQRLITTSQTYRQSSAARPDAVAKDADARLLWRFPPRRLEAEAIRDSLLAVSGKLNFETGGPGFNLFDRRGGLSDYTALETFGADGWRRMIYAHKIRMQAVDIFGAFDCPDGGQMTPERTRSITPLQSLSLFNSPFVNRQAVFFAERLRSEVGDEPASQIDRALELALSRAPEQDERELLMQLAADHGLEQACRVIFNMSEFVFLR